MSVQWAISQENLAISFEETADQGDDVRQNLQTALDHVESSLTVFDGNMSYNLEKATRLRDRIISKIEALD